MSDAWSNGDGWRMTSNLTQDALGDGGSNKSRNQPLGGHNVRAARYLVLCLHMPLMKLLN